MGNGTADAFLQEALHFREFGAPTERVLQDGIPCYINEFWTARQRQGHSLHEIPYRACFKAELPGFFIQKLTKAGEVVYDPFMGRGTTLLQAALDGRKPFGNDINPLSVFLLRPRLSPVDIGEIEQALEKIPFKKRRKLPKRPDDLLTFYHPETLKELQNLRVWLLKEAPHADGPHSSASDWIRMAALTRLSGHSPGFFSVKTMPPNQAVSAKSQRALNRKKDQTPPYRDIKTLILKKIRSLLRQGAPSATKGFRLSVGPAWETPQIPPQSVDLVVTSPPFLDVVDYAADNWLRCWFAGIDPKELQISCPKDPGQWQAMVRKTFAELARIVRTGGHVAFEVGEVRKGAVLLERLAWEAAENLPFERLGVLINRQRFTKTANCWGVTNGKGGTNTNRIVLLKRF